MSTQTNTVSKPHVAVIGFINKTNDESFSTPSETATNNLVFSLRMLGLYEVTETNTIPGEITDKNLEAFCRNKGFDYVVYGDITAGQNDSQIYGLSVFNSGQKKTTIQDSAKGFTVLDVFSVMDTLLPSILGSITGKHIGFGAISFKNTGVSGQYEVDIDGTIIPDSPSTADYIVSGHHSLRIMSDTNGIPVEVTSMLVNILEGETATVSFALPEQKADEPEAIAVPEDTVETPPVIEKIWGPNFSLYGLGLYPINDYAKMVKAGAGAGILGEFRLSQRNEIYFILRAQGDMMLPVSDAIKSYLNAAALAGFAVNFVTLPHFAMQGEIAGGVWIHSLDLDTTVVNSKMPQSYTVAPAIQASIALRVFAGSFGFEAAPVFTVLPEKITILYLAGLRTGIVIRFETRKGV